MVLYDYLPSVEGYFPVVAEIHVFKKICSQT